MGQTKTSIQVRAINETINVLDIAGEINAFAEHALMDAYQAAVQNGARLVLLNFSRLEYMNSSGIGLLVTLLVRARRNSHRLMAYGLSSHYRQIFELTRLSEAMSVFATESEALASVKIFA